VDIITRSAPERKGAKIEQAGLRRRQADRVRLLRRAGGYLRREGEVEVSLRLLRLADRLHYCGAPQPWAVDRGARTCDSGLCVVTCGPRKARAAVDRQLREIGHYEGPFSALTLVSASGDDARERGGAHRKHVDRFEGETGFRLVGADHLSPDGAGWKPHTSGVLVDADGSVVGPGDPEATQIQEWWSDAGGDEAHVEPGRRSLPAWLRYAANGTMLADSDDPLWRSPQLMAEWYPATYRGRPIRYLPPPTDAADDVLRVVDAIVRHLSAGPLGWKALRHKVALRDRGTTFDLAIEDLCRAGRIGFYGPPGGGDGCVVYLRQHARDTEITV
jgi:hypothetical protein